MNSLIERLTQLLPQTSGQHANVGQIERLASIGLGVGLAASGLKGGLTRTLLLGGTGAALVYRGLTGHCHLYDRLGLDTADSKQLGVAAQKGVRVDHRVQLDRSPRDVYDFWRNVENLPRIMRHLRSVKDLGGGRSRWIANGLLGTTVQWEAYILNEREGELIAWESLPGGDLETAGSIHFSPGAQGRGCEVHVQLKYNPPLGKAGASMASFFGEDATQRIREDLDRLAQVFEGESKAKPSAAQLVGGLGSK